MMETEHNSVSVVSDVACCGAVGQLLTRVYSVYQKRDTLLVFEFPTLVRCIT